MKIIYITNSRIPTEKAHGFQVMKMSEAFSNAGVELELWVPGRFNQIKENPFDYYSIRKTFGIKRIPVIDLIPLEKFLGPIVGLIESISFTIFVLYNLYRSGSTQIEADQRRKKTELLYEDITYKIRGACFKVWRQFRGGFNEKIIERALSEELTKNGLIVKAQVKRDVIYDNKKIGIQVFDIVINDLILIELKAVPFLREENRRQFWAYIKNSPYKLGLLINFGNKLEIERRIFDKSRFPHKSAENPQISASNEIIIYSRDQFICWFLSFLNRKFIYEIHSFPKNLFWYKRLWRRAYRLVAITQGLKNLLIKQGIRAEKITVAPDGVDLEAFNAVNQSKEELKIELGLPAGDFLAGYVGKFKTLGMEKGIKTMIMALPLLEKDIKMVFVGGEELEIKEYKNLANRLNVSTQCLFISYQSYLKVIKYTKAMDALVIPFPNFPHYAFYASPLKLFEYMASGRPIVASDLPALREVLNDKNALFFKPDNDNDLARAIKMLKLSQTLGYHLSQQALADVKQYTWDKRAERILEFIESC